MDDIVGNQDINKVVEGENNKVVEGENKEEGNIAETSKIAQPAVTVTNNCGMKGLCNRPNTNVGRGFHTCMSFKTFKHNFTF